MARDRTAGDVRSALRSVAYAGNEAALREYAHELERMDPAIAEVVRKSAADIAAISRENPGKARRVVDELAMRILAEHGLQKDSPRVDDEARGRAERILGQGPGVGHNSAEDQRLMRHARAASEQVDRALGGERAPWAQ
jgi:hypothetical protein